MIGDPVEHSLSPVLHNTAYQSMGVDWVYVAFPVASGRGAEAVRAAHLLGIAGLSVTMPHKSAVAEAVDHLSPDARRLASVNTLTFIGDEVRGDSTDGLGFIDALGSELGWSPQGESCAVLGAGGAARAVVLALAEAGAREVIVAARDLEAARVCAGLAGPKGVVGGIEAACGAALVVNATPVGMAGATAGLPFGVSSASFRPGQFVVDLIYSPARTALMEVAAGAGAQVSNGLGMLVHQAARQVELWTGMQAPVAEMEAAAKAALQARN